MANPHGQPIFISSLVLFSQLVGQFTFPPIQLFVSLFLFTSYLSSKSLGFTLCHVFGLSPKLSRKFSFALHMIISQFAFTCPEYCLQCYLDLVLFDIDMIFVPIQSPNFSPETSTSDATSRLFLQMSLIALQVGQQNAPQKRPSGPSFFGEVFLLGFYIRSPSLVSRFF